MYSSDLLNRYRPSGTVNKATDNYTHLKVWCATSMASAADIANRARISMPFATRESAKKSKILIIQL